MCLTLQLMAAIAPMCLASDAAISRAADFLRQQEGLRLECYHDSLGYPTIGYGHRLYDWLPSPVTREYAEGLFAQDMAKAVEGACRAYPEMPEYPEAVQTVLISLAFQTGVKGLLAFHRMQTHIRLHDYIRAAGEIIDSKLARETPRRARALAAILAGAK